MRRAGIVEISDPADPRVADYVGLTDAALRRRVEAGGPHGIFVAEGVHVVRRLLASGLRVRSVLVIPRRVDAMAALAAAHGVPLLVATPAVMNAVAGFEIHRGVVAAADRPAPADPWTLVARARRVAVLEAIADHENLGALFRSAAALGTDAVLLSPACCDPLYRRSVRVSAGHVLDVPWAVLEPWPECLADLAAQGFEVVALTPRVSAVPITALRLREAAKVAVLVGAEDRGLTAGALAAATVHARIAMAPGADSLNVAAAGAIAFHEAWPGEG